MVPGLYERAELLPATIFVGRLPSCRCQTGTSLAGDFLNPRLLRVTRPRHDEARPTISVSGLSHDLLDKGSPDVCLLESFFFARLGWGLAFPFLGWGV